MDHDLPGDDDPTSGDNDESEQGGPLRLTRRRALLAAAWTVPVILVAQATPAAASSNALQFVDYFSCQHSNDAGAVSNAYHFTLRIVNTTNAPMPLSITQVLVGGSSLSSRTFSVGAWVAPTQTSLQFNVPPGTNFYIMHAASNGDASNAGNVQITYTYGGVGGTLTGNNLSTSHCLIE